MSAVTRTRRPAWPWAWALVIIALGVLNVSIFGDWSGDCIDYVGTASGLSSCTVGTATGWPGAWVIAALSVLGVVYAGYRIARRDR